MKVIVYHLCEISTAEYGTATPWEEDIDFDIYLFI